MRASRPPRHETKCRLPEDLWAWIVDEARQQQCSVNAWLITVLSGARQQGARRHRSATSLPSGKDRPC